MMPDVFDQWSTARPFLGAAPAWAPAEDQARIGAYSFYEQAYWNVPEAFKLVQRGKDTKPIYVPSAKVIVETMHRYLAPGMRIIPDPELGSDSEKAAALLAWKLFSRRERLGSRFSSNKRYGLIRGDWLWHLTGDPERDAGARISMMPLDPGSVFKITMEDDVDTVIGYHIVDTIMVGSDPAIQRQTYRKVTERGGPSPITVEEAIFKVDAWGGPDMDEKTIQVLRPPELLPDPIDSLPIYHMRNFQEPLAEWGSSEIRGLERLIAAINQSISDEELELVLNGLGVYATDAGSPVDADGNPTSWNLGPAKVVELPAGKTFDRVDGTKTVTPHQDHLKYLHEQLDLGAGTPPIAKGKVDVQVAESGIARLMELAPIFSRAEEKEQDITDVMTNLLFDLKKWWQAFDEGPEFNLSDNVALIPSYGARIPDNPKQKFDEIMKMGDSNTPLVSAAWQRKELAKLGYEFGDDTEMLAEILQEKQALAQIAADVTGSRIDGELNSLPPDPNAAGDATL